MAAQTPPLSIPRGLFAVTVFYGGMVCLAGVLGNKQVALGPLAVEAGIFAFLLLVVASSAVAECYGRAVANRLVLLGFAPLLASIVLTGAVLSLPASAEMEPARKDAFALMMGGTPRIWLGGIIAYGISQLLNVAIFDRLKGASGQFLWLRAAAAAMLSQAVDTVLFISIAFYGVFPIASLLGGQLVAKLTLSALLVPPLVTAVVAMIRRMDGAAK